MLRKDEKIGPDGNKRWSVIKKIGEGGFAEVYEVLNTAKNTKVLGPGILPCILFLPQNIPVRCDKR
jgi:serine/threonine protein kinase